MEVDDSPHIEKAGICVGSYVAPNVSEVFLHVLDSAVRKFLNSLKDGLILLGRYLGDLVLCFTEPQVVIVLKLFILQCCS